MEEKSEAPQAEYQSPSMGDMLKQAHSNLTNESGSEPSENTSEKEVEIPAAEKKELDAKPETPKLEEPVREVPKEDSPVSKDDGSKSEERMVPLSALKAERERRRAADAALAAIKAQGLSTEQPTMPEEPRENWAEPAQGYQAPVRSNFELLTSEKLARLEHPDYDEKYKAFEEHFAQSGDKALLQSILASDHPGEAAYIAGRTLLEGKKYGFEVVNDPVKYRQALRADLEKEIRNELGAKEKSTVASRISDRSKTPTDIGIAKAASGSSAASYHSPSMAEMLSRVQKSKKRF